MASFPSAAPALSFLATHNPAAAASINSEFPFLSASAAESSPSVSGSPAAADDMRKEYEEKALRKLYEETLVTSFAVSEKKMLSIKKNLTREKRGKIASEGLRHLTTASFVGILTSDKEIIEMVAAIVGLISASILIVNQYNNVTILNGKDLNSMYKELVALKKRANITLGQIRLEKEVATIKQLVRTANEIIFEIEGILEFIP